MAKDDMFVIMYRILAYIYVCEKQGGQFDEKAISWGKIKIPESYWIDVIEEIKDHGYIKGVHIKEFCGGAKMVEWDRPKITQEGVEFINENFTMAKAKEVLKGLKEVVPGL